MIFDSKRHQHYRTLLQIFLELTTQNSFLPRDASSPILIALPSLIFSDRRIAAADFEMETPKLCTPILRPTDFK
jgi:hypothetical protein